MTDIDRSKFKDSGGRLLTQGLFLEIDYNADRAVYTLDDFDKTYEGKVFPSLKRLYLLEEDPKEYIFATTHLYNWAQWQRILANKVLRKHVDVWREELELKMASKGLQSILDLMDSENGNFQAAKFIAKREWDAKAGRPSNEEKEKRQRQREVLESEFEDDIKRAEEYYRVN